MVIKRSQIHIASLYCTHIKKGIIQQNNVLPLSMTPKHEGEFCDKRYHGIVRHFYSILW